MVFGEITVSPPPLCRSSVSGDFSEANRSCTIHTHSTYLSLSPSVVCLPRGWVRVSTPRCAFPLQSIASSSALATSSPFLHRFSPQRNKCLHHHKSLSPLHSSLTHSFFHPLSLFSFFPFLFGPPPTSLLKFSNKSEQIDTYLTPPLLASLSLSLFPFSFSLSELFHHRVHLILRVIFFKQTPPPLFSTRSCGA